MNIKPKIDGLGKPIAKGLGKQFAVGSSIFVADTIAKLSTSVIKTKPGLTTRLMQKNYRSNQAADSSGLHGRNVTSTPAGISGLKFNYNRRKYY